MCSWFCRQTMRVIVISVALTIGSTVMTPATAGDANKNNDPRKAPISLDLVFNPAITDSLPADSKKLSLDDAKVFLTGICDQGLLEEMEGYDGQKLATCVAMSDYTSGWCADGGIGLTHVTYGSYTKLGEKEAILDYEGCEPNSNNSGGSILMRQTDGVWRKVSIAPGVRSSVCLKFSQTDGTDMLACYFSISRAGVETGNVSILHVRNDLIDEKSLLYFESPDVELACGGAAHYSAVSLLEWQKLQLAKTGSTVLKVGVIYANVPLTGICPGEKWSPSNKATHEKKIHKVESLINLQLKSGTVIFLQKGSDFVVAPESQETHRMLEHICRLTDSMTQMLDYSTCHHALRRL